MSDLRENLHSYTLLPPLNPPGGQASAHAGGAMLVAEKTEAIASRATAEIRRCTVTELAAAPNIAAVLAEYARESSLAELGATSPQWDTYRALEAAGVFYPIAAFEGARLCGFILPIVVALPHYGVLAATIESFFVPRAERHKNIGIKLLHVAEDLARSLGAKALLLSSPVGGALSRVVPAMGYRHSNEVFLKALA